MAPFIILFCVAFIIETGVSALVVSVKSDGPAVRGSNVTFTATVADYEGQTLRYVFRDNAQPHHSVTIEKATNVTNWTVEYTRELNEAGEYTVTVKLQKYIVFDWYTISEAQTKFLLTDDLHGSLVLNQNSEDRLNYFVAVNKEVFHYVKLPDNELKFLKENSSQIITYWFLDCNYIDKTTDFSFNYTYNESMTDHIIGAVVVANNEPLQPITTTTIPTTTTPTTTTPPPTTPPTTTPPTTTSPTTTPPTKTPPTTTPPTTTLPTTTLPTTTPPSTKTATSLSNTPSTSTQKSLSSTTDGKENLPIHKISKRAVTNKIALKRNNAIQDNICNYTLPTGKNFTVGHYEDKLSVREPISTVNITGLNWLQHGDLLNLLVKYEGSPPFNYCIQYRLGEYNITGNETCTSKTSTTLKMFPLVHYFSDSDQHTVVVVIENDIDKIVGKATINIYKAPVNTQLSIIMVPVFFSLVAVILVVFGIAYYQHRTRHTVEVADFEFAQAHLEYKTFTERLRDSFRNAFNFRHHEDTEALTTNTRYDSMT